MGNGGEGREIKMLEETRIKGRGERVRAEKGGRRQKKRKT
jgi:hypothetical protein